MGTRLKRRSSIGFGGRRDSFSTPPESHTPEMFDQDDDEERRVRNLQRRQAKNLDTAISQDSPGVERTGSSRRSIGGLSGLSAAQLADHYTNCIKLCAENKISTKNAFNLQLIDYMATMVKKKESDMNNFQLAAGTLDASTKIYAYRVDSVYGDTLKIAGGLGQAGRQDPGEQEGDVEEGDQEGSNADQPKKKRRLKKSATVEKNLKNINVNKFELEFDVDPLFKKTSSQFDSGSGGNQFLASLQIRDDTCELMLDSDKMLERVNTGATPVKEAPFGEFSTVTSLDFRKVETAPLCPTFEGFSFKWSLEKEGNDEDEFSSRLNESISASQEERNNFSRIDTGENAFDALAVPESHGEEFGDYGEPGDAGDMDDMERTEWSERAVGHTAAGGAKPGLTASLPMTTEDMLSVLTTAPLEYSYFDTGKLGAWAGPKHWKFKPISKTVEADKTKGRKKKEISQMVYANYNGKIEDEATEISLGKVGNLLMLPKKSVKLVEKTMKGWNREKNTLPEDLHYSGHELVRLKTVDRMVIQNIHNNNHNRGTTVDDVEAYNYENAADQEGYCPDFADATGAYAEGETGETYSQDTMMTSRLETRDQEVPDITAMSGELYAADNLVAAPKLVDKAALQIGYAKTAKKVDMKRIKSVAWNILTKASSNKEKENTSGSPEKQVDKEARDEPGTKFSTLYKTLKHPAKIGRTMSENLSVPLAFIALLHLCNEENLSLTSRDEMDDFTISMSN